jgi:hypothetical protein
LVVPAVLTVQVSPNPVIEVNPDGVPPVFAAHSIQQNIGEPSVAGVMEAVVYEDWLFDEVEPARR